MASEKWNESSMSDRTSLLDGVRLRFLYGTAWKEERTQRLTEQALRQGFRGIDTANQRKHYHEAAIGQAIGSVVADGLVTREDLFLQTKFTFRPGQDHRLPYDPRAPIHVQVEQSFASSLEHLGVEVIDSYLLHGPTQRTGLAAARNGKGPSIDITMRKRCRPEGAVFATESSTCRNCGRFGAIEPATNARARSATIQGARTA